MARKQKNTSQIVLVEPVYGVVTPVVPQGGSNLCQVTTQTAAQMLFYQGK